MTLEWNTANTGDGDSDRDILLDVKELRVHYETPLGDVIAANGISFHVYRGETLGLVGESGCGKTTTAMGILRLVQPPGRIVSGHVLINGTDLVTLSERELRQIRWRELALIPQGAMNSLNPVMRVSDQIADAIEAHEGRQPRKALKERILELLSTVGLPSRVYNMYPHELSGGMKQRVCIAMAIALNPPLIIADEPTSALDVVVQRVVAQTLLDVKDRLGVSMILIGHDMGLQAQLVDRIAIMYAGQIMEKGATEEVTMDPRHPYTRGLLRCLPRIHGKREKIQPIPGLVPDLATLPPGCPFAPRCDVVQPECWEDRRIPLQEIEPGRWVRCLLY